MRYLTGSRLFVGFWGGSGENDPPDTEPSFWCKNKEVALETAKLFNQNSILDWNAVNSKSPDKYTRNDFYNEESPKYTKEQILKIIRKEN